MNLNENSSSITQPVPGRVLMLVENNSFPWDRRMRHLAMMLHEAGYQVSVISPLGEKSDRAFHEVANGVRVYRYPMLWQASGPIGYLFEYSWGFFCATILSLLVWMKDGFEVIHAANPPDMFFPLAWFYKLLGKRFVYDQHDVCPELYESKFDRRDWPYRILVAFERLSYHAADLVISTNQSYCDIARERGGITPERSAIVRNGVDLQHFYRRTPRPELKENFPYMAAYLGVMGKQDGVDRVVQAAYEVVFTHGRKDVLFVMVGAGECWQELQELSRELKVDPWMRFVGRISDDLLLDYLSTADICLAPDPPDRMNQLSTMTKIMEYMACQRPIVSFDLLETRRSAGNAAVYVEREDPALFADAMLQLLDNPDARARMGQIGLDRTRNLVGLDRSRQAMLEAYGRMLGRPIPVAAPEETEKAHVGRL